MKIAPRSGHSIFTSSASARAYDAPMGARILVVEDEPQLRGLLRLYLERDGHRVTDAGDVPVLITSAKRTDAERISGLRAGADDYLAKPFNPHELTARVAAILRRTRASQAEVPPPILSLDGGGRGA